MLVKNLLISSTKNSNLLRLCSPITTNNRKASHFKFRPDTAPAELGETTKMNLFQAVNNSMDISLSADKSAGSSKNL